MMLPNAAKSTSIGLLVICGVAGSISAGLTPLDTTEQWTRLLVILFGVLAITARYSYRRARMPITTTILVCSTLFILFCTRPLAVISTRLTSAGARVDAHPLDATVATAGSLGLLLVIWFAVSFGVGAIMFQKDDPVRLQGGRTPPVEGRVSSRVVPLLVISLIVAAMSSGYLVLSGGGPAAYFAGISNRSSFLSGRGYLTLAYLPLLVSLVIYCQRGRDGRSDPPRRSLLLLSIAVLAGACVVSGARSQVLLGCVLPLVLVKQYGFRPFSKHALAAIAGLGAVTAILMGLVLRDATFDQGASLVRLRQDPVGLVRDRLLGGIETRPFDSLVRLMEEDSWGDVRLQQGSTYLAAPAWFVPRQLWSGKPYGGGNRWFTSNYEPRFYGTERVETSLSAVGEAYANFSWLGVILVGFLLGVVAGRLSVSGPTTRGDPWITTKTACIGPVAVSFTRGDAFHNLPLAFLTLILVLSFGLLCFEGIVGGTTTESDAPNLNRVYAVHRKRSFLPEGSRM
jgi:hypothetical protein